MKTQAASTNGKPTGARTLDGLARGLMAPAVAAMLALAAPAGPLTSSAWAATFLERAQQYFDEGDLQAAEVELKNALQRDPTDADARFLLGRVHLQNGDPAAAEKEFVRAQELGYTGPDLDLMLAYARLSLKRYDDVVKALPETLSQDSPMTRDLMVARGEALLNLGQFATAEQVFDQVLGQGPHVRALVNKARLAVMAENPAQARAYLDRAIAIEPDFPLLVAVDAELLYRERRYEEAKQRFARAIELDGNQAIARLGYIQSLIALGDLEEAERVVKNLLASQPSDLRVILQSSIVQFLRGNYSQAKIAADRVLSAADRQAQALLISGYSAYRLRQYEQARARLTTYLSLQPQDDRARGVLGASLMQLGYTDQAYEVLGAFAGEVPESVDYLEVLTDAALASRDAGGATRYIEHLAKANPDDVRVQEKLGRIRLANGDLESAAEAFQAALAIEPSRQQVYASLFSVYMRQRDYEKALDLARRLQEHLPEKALGFGMEGAALTASGDLATAEAAFRTAISKAPEDPLNVGNLARLLRLDGRDDEARKVFDDALAESPDDLDILLRYANLETEAGDLEKATSLLRSAVEKHPGSIRARMLLSNALRSAGKPEEALAVSEDALAANPNRADLIESAGLAALESEDWTSATTGFRTLTELQPDRPRAFELYSLALEGSGDLEGALQALDKATALTKTDAAYAPARHRILLRLGRLDEAKPVLDLAKATHPEATETYLMEGSHALASNQASAAASAFEKAFAQAPESATLLDLVRAKQAAGQVDESVALMETWLDENPQDLLVLRYLAGTLTVLRDWNGAEDKYKAILDIKPNEVVTLNNLAMIQLEQDSVPDAVDNARKAVALAPQEPAVADTLGIALLRAGEQREAVSVLTAARQAAPQSGSIGFHLAQALSAAGDVEGAVAVLEEILGSDRRFGERGDAEALLASLTR
ncbi:MAG: PEP-CTERM system TPR-repeat protein PrsT [Kiloniellaceae bacterium]